MKQTHIFVVAIGLAAAAGFGLLAVSKTTTLGASARRASDATITAQTRKLDRFEASLRQALARRTPALPKVPVVRPVPPASSPAPATAVPQQQVVYRRPPPVVVHTQSSHHGDDGYEGSERGDGGGGDD
jgi:hypothetical protein